MSCYSYRYNNDTGPSDESYYDFYEILDLEGDVIGKIDKEDDALKVCIALNMTSEFAFKLITLCRESFKDDNFDFDKLEQLSKLINQK